MRPDRAKVLSVLALAIACATTGSARADEPSADASAKAKSLFEVGGRAYDNGEFDVALQAFEQAYAIFPKETLLFSMAQAHRRLYIESQDTNHRDEAIRLFREYLAKVSSGKHRAEANKLLGELSSGATPTDSKTPATPKPKTGKTRLFVSSGTPNATVSIDGGAAVPVNKTVDIAPGKHSLLLAAAGFVDQKLDVDAAQDEVTPVTYELKEKLGAVDVATTSGAAVNVDGRFVGLAPLARPLELSSGEHFIGLELAGHETRSKTITTNRGATEKLDLPLPTTVQRYLAYGFLGTAGVAAVAAGAFTGVAFYEQGLAKDVLAKQQSTGLAPADPDAYDAARSRRNEFVLAAGITGAGAGALGVLGLCLLLVNPPERAIAPARKDEAPIKKPSTPEIEDVSIVPIVTPDTFGVVAGFRF